MLILLLLVYALKPHFLTVAMHKTAQQLADAAAAAMHARDRASLALGMKLLHFGSRVHGKVDLLREAKQQAQDILVQADRRATQIMEEAKTTAKAEGGRLVAGAKAEIEQEVSRAKEMLRTQVAALAVAGAEQILKREVDAKTHADILASVQRQL